MTKQQIVSKSVEETYQYIFDKFSNNKRVVYSRFGDGDLEVMQGNDQQNHKFSEGLSNELKEAFNINEANYLRGLAINYPVEKGMSYGLFYPYARNEMMEKYLLTNYEIPTGYVFESAWFFHYLTVYKPQLVINMLDELIRPKKKMFIGNIPKESIERLIGPVDYHVETPFKNAYFSIEEWWPNVEKNLRDVEIVIPAVGLTGRAVNKRIWQSGVEVQSFDIGSVVDAVDQRKSRKWIKLLGHRVDSVLLGDKSFSDKLNYHLKEMYFQLRWLVKSNKKEKLM